MIKICKTSLLKESRSEVKGNDQRKEGKRCGTFEPNKKDRPAKRKRCRSNAKDGKKYQERHHRLYGLLWRHRLRKHRHDLGGREETESSKDQSQKMTVSKRGSSKGRSSYLSIGSGYSDRNGLFRQRNGNWK